MITAKSGPCREVCIRGLYIRLGVVEIKEYPWLPGGATVPVGGLVVPVETHEAEPGCLGSARSFAIICLFLLLIELLVLFAILVMLLLLQQASSTAQGVPTPPDVAIRWASLDFQSVRSQETAPKQQGSDSGARLRWQDAVGNLPRCASGVPFL